MPNKPRFLFLLLPIEEHWHGGTKATEIHEVNHKKIKGLNCEKTRGHAVP